MYQVIVIQELTFTWIGHIKYAKRQQTLPIYSQYVCQSQTTRHYFHNQVYMYDMYDHRKYLRLVCPHQGPGSLPVLYLHKQAIKAILRKKLPINGLRPICAVLRIDSKIS
jgi:hypothetical protein